jgi:hypothetical protein
MLDVALCVLCVAVCAAMCCTRGHTPHVQAKKQKVTYSEAFSFFFFFCLLLVGTLSWSRELDDKSHGSRDRTKSTVRHPQKFSLCQLCAVLAPNLEF